MSKIFQWPVDRWQFQSVTFELFPASLTSTSPYTGTTKAVNLATIWRATLSLNNLPMADAIELQQFLDELEGPRNRVMLYDKDREWPQAVNLTTETFSDATTFSDGTGWSGPAWSVFVAAAAAKGSREVALSGMPTGAKFLSRGDLLEIGNGFGETDLYEARHDLTPNSSGAGALQVLPGLRKGLAVGDTVRLFRPRGRFRRADTVSVVRNITHGEPVSLTFAEDVR